MTPPVSTEPSPPAPRREKTLPLRILAAIGENLGGAVGPSLRQWCDEVGLEVAVVPDLPRAVRQLAGEPWDIVFAVLDETADNDLTWWADALRADA